MVTGTLHSSTDLLVNLTRDAVNQPRLIPFEAKLDSKGILTVRGDPNVEYISEDGIMQTSAVEYVVSPISVGSC